MERFPEDEMVVELGLDSYLAVARRGSDGGRLGRLGVLAKAPLYPDDGNVAALRIFAARARRRDRASRPRARPARTRGVPPRARRSRPR